MRNRNKQNAQVPSNMHPKYSEVPIFGSSAQNIQHFSNKQLSPIRKHKFSDSEVMNQYEFEEFARSTTSILNPLSQMNQPFKMQQQRFSNTLKNIINMTDDPQADSHWKNKYQQLYDSYQMLQNKLEFKTKENLKLVDTITDQQKKLKRLSEQNFQLNNRHIRMMEQKNMWGGNIQSSFMSGNQDSNQNQLNRYYIEELERNVDNLQRQNKRLSDVVKRNMRNCFQY